MTWIKKIVLFPLIVFVLYALSVALLNRVSLGTYPLIYGLSDGLNMKGGNSYQKFMDFDTSVYHDFVVLGSSHAYRGYDPRIFEEQGAKMFNLGSSSQTPYNSFFLVQDLLRKENCGTVILDVFHVALQMDGLESTSDLVANLKNDGSAFEMALGHRDPRALNMFANRMLSKDQSAQYVDTSYIGNGFSENRALAPKGVSYPSDGAFKPVDNQLEYLQKMVAICKRKNISLILVDHPLPEPMRGERLFSATQWIKRFADSQELPFLDFSGDSDYDAQFHFYDHTHLNQNGVHKFNNDLIREMKASDLWN